MTGTGTYVTLARLARRLGLQYYQVQHFIRTGRLRTAPARNGSKRKTWTAEEVERIEKWYRDYVRLDAGCCGQDGQGVASK